MRDVHEELRARLRESAEAHEPDRARILARIERGMAAPEEQRARSRKATRPPLWGWVRVVSATAGVAGVLAVGGYAVASAVKADQTPADRTVAVSPTPVDSPAATSRPPEQPEQPTPTPRDKGGTKKPSSTPSNTPSPEDTQAPPELPASGNEEDGPLWSDGSVDPHSNDFWAQSNVTLKTDEQLTELTVQLRIAQTGGVTSAGAWRSLPEQDFDLTVEESDGFLVYTWVLKDGRTVPEGEFVFAGQYNHERGGRDAGDDTYAMTAKADGKDLAVAGDFEGQDDDSSDEGDS
ncbi:anti-sigma factor [Streptomyces sp. NPDC002643]